jgi:antitoxin HicB
MVWTTERQMRYRVLLQQDEDGAWVAEVPALPGCVSQGRTRDEAVANVREAMAAYVESVEEHGDPVPPPIAEEIVEL